MDERVNGHDTPLRVFVLDNMRKRSHLWFRMLSQHPRFESVYHPYLLTTTMGPYIQCEFLKHSEERHKEIVEDWVPMHVTETHESQSKMLLRCVREIEEKV